MIVSTSMVRNCTVKVLVPDSLTYVLCGIGVLITLVAVLSNISMLMFISDTRVKKQSMFFFKMTTVTFMTTASVGKFIRSFSWQLSLLYKVSNSNHAKNVSVRFCCHEQKCFCCYHWHNGYLANFEQICVVHAPTKQPGCLLAFHEEMNYVPCFY